MMLRKVSLFALALACALISAPALADQRCDNRNAVYGQKGEWVLSLSWTPGFCKSKGRSTGECAKPDTRLDLHGLWPQGAGMLFCSKDEAQNQAAACKKRDALKEVDISPLTRPQLEDAMPAARENLDRYEWVKHGTCSGMTPGAYFGLAVQMVERVRASGLGQIVKPGIPLTRKAICDAFAKDFATPAALNLEVKKMDGKLLVTGANISLVNDADGKLFLDSAHLLADKQSVCRSELNPNTQFYFSD